MHITDENRDSISRKLDEALSNLFAINETTRTKGTTMANPLNNAWYALSTTTTTVLDEVEHATATRADIIASEVDQIVSNATCPHSHVKTMVELTVLQMLAHDAYEHIDGVLQEIISLASDADDNLYDGDFDVDYNTRGEELTITVEHTNGNDDSRAAISAITDEAESAQRELGRTLTGPQGQGIGLSDLPDVDGLVQYACSTCEQSFTHEQAAELQARGATKVL